MISESLTRIRGTKTKFEMHQFLSAGIGRVCKPFSFSRILRGFVQAFPSNDFPDIKLILPLQFIFFFTRKKNKNISLNKNILSLKGLTLSEVEKDI